MELSSLWRACNKWITMFLQIWSLCMMKWSSHSLIMNWKSVFFKKQKINYNLRQHRWSNSLQMLELFLLSKLIKQSQALRLIKLKILTLQKWCLILRKKANCKTRQMRIGKQNKMNKIKNKSLKSLTRRNKLLLPVRLVLHKKEIKKKKKILIWNLRRMQMKEKMKKIKMRIKYKENMLYQIIKKIPKLKMIHLKKSKSEV
jgi:hypothetical protein